MSTLFWDENKKIFNPVLLFWDAHVILNLVIEMEKPMEMAMKILHAMNEKQVSYGELSAMTGIPKSALQRYATGETEKIPLPRIEQIANALDISAAYLLGWEVKKESTEVSENKKALLELIDKMPEEKIEAILKLLGGE